MKIVHTIKQQVWALFVYDENVTLISLIESRHCFFIVIINLFFMHINALRRLDHSMSTLYPPTQNKFIYFSSYVDAFAKKSAVLLTFIWYHKNYFYFSRNSLCESEWFLSPTGVELLFSRDFSQCEITACNVAPLTMNYKYATGKLHIKRDQQFIFCFAQLRQDLQIIHDCRKSVCKRINLKKRVNVVKKSHKIATSYRLHIAENYKQRNILINTRFSLKCHVWF